MNCPKCKATNEDDAVICRACGERLDREAQAKQMRELEAEMQPGASERRNKATPPASDLSPAEQLLASGNLNDATADDANHLEGPWYYSGRAMRGTFLITGLVTILLIALGVALEWLGWLRGWQLIGWGLLLGIAAVLWIYQLMVYAIRRFTVRYSLTPFRLFHEEGLLVRRKHVLEVVDIDDMESTQSLWQRFVCGNVGTIRIVSSDPGNPELIIDGLANYEEVFSKIDEARRKQRAKRGLKAI
jgi:membrane protein YdbS with pleckstrin-like domain